MGRETLSPGMIVVRKEILARSESTVVRRQALREYAIKSGTVAKFLQD
jgi:hypothetical protein